MKRACAAFAVDMKNPCGSFGYAVAPQIATCAQFVDEELLQVRRPGLRDPHLGLRRQGLRTTPTRQGWSANNPIRTACCAIFSAVFACTRFLDLNMTDWSVIFEHEDSQAKNRVPKPNQAAQAERRADPVAARKGTRCRCRRDERPAGAVAAGDPPRRHLRPRRRCCGQAPGDPRRSARRVLGPRLCRRADGRRRRAGRRRQGHDLPLLQGQGGAVPGAGAHLAGAGGRRAEDPRRRRGLGSRAARSLRRHAGARGAGDAARRPHSARDVRRRPLSAARRVSTITR